jgi:hypothetical protein
MLAAAQDEIEDLKKVISGLETQLADAKKELTVSHNKCLLLALSLLPMTTNHYHIRT